MLGAIISVAMFSYDIVSKSRTSF